MLIPLSWLRDFIDLGDVSAYEIAERLSLQSVEALVETFGIELEGVVFGKVVSLGKHPQKKSLKVTKVQVGRDNYLTIVTADTTLKEKDGVIVALPGARVGTKQISKREFGKVISEGVLLSAEELGLEDAQEGVLKVPEDIEPGTDAKEVLGFGEELIELDITPNRGDVLSVKGLARDLRAIFGFERVNSPSESYGEKGNINIEVKDSDCGRYRGAVIEGLSVSVSPLWIRRRLWQSGIKSINNVVDVTNYILLQEGQPLHAFDLDKLEKGIIVRSAEKGERITTLDGEERELDEEALVIADEKKPIAVAGIIGGLDTSVSDSTKSILLEAAYFSPNRIRRSSKKLSVQTDSSYRFERNVDVESLPRAQDRAIKLILDTAGGGLVAIKDIYPNPYSPKKIFLSMGKFMRYAGESYKNEEAGKILEALEIPHEIKRCGIEVFVPAHRSFDLHRDVDVIEELMRVKGYDYFASDTLQLPALGRLWQDDTLELKKYLRDKGLYEVLNISYEEEELYEVLGMERPSVEIINPLVPSQRFLRASLLPSLIRTAFFNESHYNYDVALFEVGKVFTGDGEEERLGILVKGRRRDFPPQDWDAYALLDVVQGLGVLFRKEISLEPSELPHLHPHVQVSVSLDGKSIGALGKLHPKIADRLDFRRDVFLAEVSLGGLKKIREPYYRELFKFPPVIRDLSLLMDKSVSVSKLLNEIKSHVGEMAEEVMVFDVYAGEKVGEGMKGVGVRIAFRSAEGSLSNEEVNNLVESLIKRLREALGVEIR